MVNVTPHTQDSRLTLPLFQSQEPAAYDEIPCLRCGDAGDEASFVLCESCPRGGHFKCLGLSCVPEDDWFCSQCELDGTAVTYRECKEVDEYTDRTDLTEQQKRNLGMDPACVFKPTREMLSVLEAYFLEFVESGNTLHTSATWPKKKRQEIAEELSCLGEVREFMNRKGLCLKNKKVPYKLNKEPDPKEADAVEAVVATQSEPRSESGEETENSDDDDPISDLAPIGVL